MGTTKKTNALDEAFGGRSVKDENKKGPKATYPTTIAAAVEEKEETNESLPSALMTIDIPVKDYKRLKHTAIHAHLPLRDIIIPEIQAFLNDLTSKAPDEAAELVKNLAFAASDAPTKRTSLLMPVSLSMALKETAADLLASTKIVTMAAFISNGLKKEV